MSINFQSDRFSERMEASSIAVNTVTKQRVSSLFPSKTLQDDKVSVDDKVAAISFYYGCIVSEIFCRIQPESGLVCRSNCTCLYDVFVGDNRDGESNAATIHATADFVVRNYYQETKIGKLCTLQMIIEKAKEDYPNVDPDKRRYYLPCLTTSSHLDRRAAMIPWETPPAPPKRRYICMYAVMTLFGLDIHLWEDCLLTVNTGRVSRLNEENNNATRNVDGAGPKRNFGGLTNTNRGNNLSQSKNVHVKSNSVLDFLSTRK